MLEQVLKLENSIKDDPGKLIIYQTNRKNMLVAYLLWFFLGQIGIHRFYLGRVRSGIYMLVLLIAGSIFLPFGIGAILLLAWGIWWIADVFLTRNLVHAYNANLITHLSSEE